MYTYLRNEYTVRRSNRKLAIQPPISDILQYCGIETEAYRGYIDSPENK